MDSVGEGEGGKIWENGIEKKKKLSILLIGILIILFHFRLLEKKKSWLVAFSPVGHV